MVASPLHGTPGVRRPVKPAHPRSHNFISLPSKAAPPDFPPARTQASGGFTRHVLTALTDGDKRENQVRVTIAEPGTASTGDLEHPDEVIPRENPQPPVLSATNPDGVEQPAGLFRCPACSPGGLFATSSLVYRRGLQPVICVAVLCGGHGQAEAARIAAYRWPHTLLDVPLPSRHQVYDLSGLDGHGMLAAHLGDWPDVLTILTAGIFIPAAGLVDSAPELAGVLA